MYGGDAAGAATQPPAEMCRRFLTKRFSLSAAMLVLVAILLRHTKQPCCSSCDEAPSVFLDGNASKFTNTGRKRRKTRPSCALMSEARVWTDRLDRVGSGQVRSGRGR